MSKKKWKKKYKELKKQYDNLWCEYARIKTDDDRIKNMTDEQILKTRDYLTCLGNNIIKAYRKANEE